MSSGSALPFALAAKGRLYLLQGDQVRAALALAEAVRAFEGHEKEMGAKALETLAALAVAQHAGGREGDARATLLHGWKIAALNPGAGQFVISLYEAYQTLPEADATIQHMGLDVHRVSMTVAGASIPPPKERPANAGEPEISWNRLESALGACPAPVKGSSSVSSADRTVAGLEWKFHSCYQNELASAPTAQGEVLLVNKIDTAGSVVRVEGLGLGVSARLLECAAWVALGAKFQALQAPATIVVPITYALSPARDATPAVTRLLLRL